MENLIKLKIQVATFHTTNDIIKDSYTYKRITRDACYTSYNSLQYIAKMAADASTDFETAVKEGQDGKLDYLNKRIERLDIEFDHAAERHEADLEVYAQLNDGERWTITTPSKTAKTIQADYDPVVAAERAAKYASVAA